MIRVIIWDDAYKPTINAKRSAFQINGVVYMPRDIADLGGVVLCSHRYELAWCIRAGYSPRFVPGLQ